MGKKQEQAKKTVDSRETSIENVCLLHSVKRDPVLWKNWQGAAAAQKKSLYIPKHSEVYSACFSAYQFLIVYSSWLKKHQYLISAHFSAVCKRKWCVLIGSHQWPGLWQYRMQLDVLQIQSNTFNTRAIVQRPHAQTQKFKIALGCFETRQNKIWFSLTRVNWVSGEWIVCFFPCSHPREPSKRLPAWNCLLECQEGVLTWKLALEVCQLLILSLMPWISISKHALAYYLLWKREDILFSMLPLASLHCTIPPLPHLQAAKNCKLIEILLSYCFPLTISMSCH